MLWGAFAALVVFVVTGVALNLGILSVERRQEAEIAQAAAPLLDAVDDMEAATTMIVSSARGYTLTQQTQFLQQYDDGIRLFEKASTVASQLASDPRDAHLIAEFRAHFTEIRELTDRQIRMTTDKSGDPLDPALEVARLRRSAPDFNGMITERQRRRQTQQLDAMVSQRQALVVVMIIGSLLLIGGAAIVVTRIEDVLGRSISRQVKRTEAMIGGMADGVMLVDSDGKTVFINPAGQKMTASSETGVPIDKQAEVYGLRSADGRQLDPRELPAAQSLANGRRVMDATLLIVRDQRRIWISMSATPLHEDGRTAGVVVTFRDITERRRLEDHMAQQAMRAQTIADAGAYFASNIDPSWVNQAIAERTAEVLGDWAAVILKTEDSKELSVAAIHHRDIASLGLAWSYIYRQPLVIGEGIIGQVVATGYPSLTASIGGPLERGGEAFHVGGATSARPMQLASLLILPLRTRREMLGALVIAANDPDRAMTDENLPLAEMLGERAALAIDNAKLYTEQVEARRKVEDLSRLKDEFLSIASHELRTPVTSIKGYTQLAKTLIREGSLTTSEEYLDIALDQIDRMSRLILELLDVSRIETGRLEIRREAIAWPSFVRDVVHRHHTAVSDRHFHLNVPNGQSIVNGDRDRLEQVLGNLLENSVKYSPEGSDIVVRVEGRSDSVITSVCDRGIGIPYDELAQVFERFHRGRQVSSTHYGGLGLGLYITKQIVERHGGTIWVESEEGRGTTFSFSLPAETVPAGAHPRTQAAVPT